MVQEHSFNFRCPQNFKGARRGFSFADGQASAPTRTPYKNIFANLGLADKIIYTGKVLDRAEIQGYYGTSDLLLFPSVFDTNGLVVREAASLRHTQADRLPAAAPPRALPTTAMVSFAWRAPTALQCACNRSCTIKIISTAWARPPRRRSISSWDARRAPCLRSLPYCDRQLQVKAIKDNKNTGGGPFGPPPAFLLPLFVGTVVYQRKGNIQQQRLSTPHGRKRLFQFNPVARGGCPPPSWAKSRSAHRPCSRP